MPTSITPLDPVCLVEALGLRRDAPRAVVKSIVTAVDAMSATDAPAIEKVLATFDLTSLLTPGQSVAALASGIADLARSDAWARLVEMRR